MQKLAYRETQICPLIAPEKPVFKVFIACEDEAAFFQALTLQEQVENRCGGEFGISRVFWNFALLRQQDLREHAIREAAESDMVIVSFQGGNELPPHVRNWVESWPTRRQTSHSALVALIGPQSDIFAEYRDDAGYLRQIAGDHGLDFFCNRDGWERLDFFRAGLRQVESQPVISESKFSFQIPWSRGGIRNRKPVMSTQLEIKNLCP